MKDASIYYNVGHLRCFPSDLSVATEMLHLCFMHVGVF